LLAEVKNPSDASATIITSQALKELTDFQAKLTAVTLTIKTDKGDKEVTWSSICLKAGPKCLYGESMLTFGQDSAGQPESKYYAGTKEADEALLARVRTGKGGRL